LDELDAKFIPYYVNKISWWTFTRTAEVYLTIIWFQ